ncbi:UNVERIFIED_CONTAM: hypothetical protein Slati_3423500 [Sesamum latifolium]|uniref:Uncharacterized protein n=1 Tax=Sesamum latifolium TaxID=2727402 RepID=A0AAW2UKP0_9LAMI
MPCCGCYAVACCIRAASLHISGEYIPQFSGHAYNLLPVLLSTSNGLAAVNLKIVFLPLLAFEAVILVDNFRMCKALLPGDDESMTDDAIWRHFHVLCAPGFCHFLDLWRVPVEYHIHGTVLVYPPALLGSDINGFLSCGYSFHSPEAVWNLLSRSALKDEELKSEALLANLLDRNVKVDGIGDSDVGALGWWDLFINYGIAECFAFLVCTKWSNPVIHRNSRTREESSSSTAIRYLDWNSGLVVSSEDHSQDRMCGLQDIGGHIMKVPIIGFQILLCMRLEGTPIGARHIPLPVLFSPIFLLQGAGVLFATSRLIEKIVLLLRSEASEGIYFVYSSRIRDCFDFLHHGSRLLGWWSIDETSREEQARLFHDGASGYNTFSGYPPEIVKKMPKKDLAEEVWRLQAALGEQTEITKFSQQEYERLQHQPELLVDMFPRKKFFVESALRGDNRCTSSL